MDSRRLLFAAFGLAAAGGVGGWLLSAPHHVDPADFAGIAGNAAQGEAVFNVGGCAACHAAPGAKGEARLALAGGRRFATAFGTFVAPNISPDRAAGIGGWSLLDFANAVQRGVSPEGRHYYPAFPYASYARMTAGDVADLWAFMQTLPPDDAPKVAHDVGFPFNVTRGLGLWKLLFADPDWVMPDAELADAGKAEPLLARGRYLVEGPGHCGECHTPRNLLGGLQRSRWLRGAPAPEGKGFTPDITPAGKEISGWSEEDIAEYLSSGFTPDYDSVGGVMVEVVDNLARLPPEDRAAIARYLKAQPAAGG